MWMTDRLEYFNDERYFLCKQFYLFKVSFNIGQYSYFVFFLQLLGCHGYDPLLLSMCWRNRRYSCSITYFESVINNDACYKKYSSMISVHIVHLWCIKCRHLYAWIIPLHASSIITGSDWNIWFHIVWCKIILFTVLIFDNPPPIRSFATLL